MKSDDKPIQKAMLLAAGRGTRLRPLTDTVPKPLIEAGGATLIEHQLHNLKRAGVTSVVINVHHLADRIQAHLGDGSRYDLEILYSVEAQLLETGGGIKRGLPLLGDQPFYVVSADVYLDYELSALGTNMDEQYLGRLLMTDNPPHHPAGDYAIDSAGRLREGTGQLTYTGISVLRPELVQEVTEDVFPLRRVFDVAVERGLLLGTRHQGYWCDVGTVARLAALRSHLAALPRASSPLIQS